MTERVRRVTANLVVAIHDPVRMMIQLAVSDTAPARIDEVLQVTCNGEPINLTETAVPGNGRIHLCAPTRGELLIDYTASITGDADPAPISEADLIVYRRPSRYAESDRLAPIAQAEFAGITDPNELLAAVSSWTGSQLSYLPGSSQPTDGAVETMLKRQGVCRDYAHLVVALLRGLDIPARFAAVYAPGLYPMDFHAVAEAAIDGMWRVVDATLLAPRSSLVRIATGRDAADTAFMSTYGGEAELLDMEVTATIDGPLPDDDIFALTSIR